MSIKTEVTRLTNAKAAIKTALEDKGVTVASSTLLGGYATLIQDMYTIETESASSSLGSEDCNFSG